MPVSLVILILYIVALFAISWYAKKRSEGNNENFALAGRRLSAPLICVTIIGLAVGGASTIGVSEHAVDACCRQPAHRQCLPGYHGGRHDLRDPVRRH